MLTRAVAPSRVPLHGAIRWAVLTAALLLGLPACGPGGSPIRPDEAESEDTTLGPGDVFDVRVYGEQDLSSNYRIAQDGTIDFPYVGRVRVAELEPTQVADLLEERLRDGGVLIQPQISIMVTEVNSKRINVTGAVRNPGNYSITPGLTALQAVGLAGGTTDLANRDGAIITRRTGEDVQRYSVPLDRITVGEASDMRVRAGDILYVPERAF